jgi:CheY-like chemotaxis protein
VENGQQAIDQLLSQPEKYDLVFMDLDMPEMDGWKATRIIREKGFKNIPIIAITTATVKHDRQKYLEAGMNDFISKPILKEVVLQVIKRWVLTKSPTYGQPET